MFLLVVRKVNLLFKILLFPLVITSVKVTNALLIINFFDLDLGAKSNNCFFLLSDFKYKLSNIWKVSTIILRIFFRVVSSKFKIKFSYLLFELYLKILFINSSVTSFTVLDNFIFNKFLTSF